jgi:hypothetical protein
MEKVKCKQTRKTRYATPGEAKVALDNLRATKRHYNYFTGKRVNRRMGKVKQCRYYHCTHCNGYHMTSAEAPIKQKTREKQFSRRLQDTANLVLNQNEADDWKKDSLPFPETKTNNNEMV